MTKWAIQAIEAGFAFAPGSEPVFGNLNLRTAPSEWLGVVGPSGCGKSTLVRLLAGLARPTTGSVSVADSDPLILQQFGKFGLSLQQHSLIPWLSVLHNIRLPALDEPPDSEDRAARIAASFGLSERLTYLPSELSGGMVARVALARSLFNDPDLVFWDEPFASLDDITIARICIYLLQLRKSRAFGLVLVSHQLETIARLSDRCLCFPKNQGGPFEVIDLGMFGAPNERGEQEYSAIRKTILEMYL